MSTTDTTQFETIHSNIVLRVERNPSNQDRKRYTSGDVAKLQDGRLIARSISHDISGSVLLHYGDYNPATPHQTLLDPSGWKPDSFFQETLAELRREPGLHECNPLPDDPIISEFCRLYPPVAAHIGLSATESAPGLFGIGKFMVPRYSIERIDKKPAQTAWMAGDI